MALLFDGTSEYLSTAWSAITATPLTIAAWCKVSATATQAALAIVNADVSPGGGWLALLGAAGNVAARAKEGVLTSQALSTATYPTGTWFHAGWVFASSTSRAAYLNGGNKGTNTTSRTPTGIAKLGIGAQVEFSVTNFLGGDLGEIAVWNAALTDDEIYTLSRGYSPLFVRRSALKFYAPLVNNIPELIGSLLLVPNGSPVASPHPRVINTAGVVYAKSAGKPAQRSHLLSAERLYGNQFSRLRGVESLLTPRCTSTMRGTEKVGGPQKAALLGRESLTVAASTRISASEMVGSHATKLTGAERLLAPHRSALSARESITLSATTRVSGNESITIAAQTKLRGNEGIVLVPCKALVAGRERVVNAQTVRCYKNTTDGGEVDVVTPFVTWAYGGPYVTPALAYPFHHRFIVRRHNGYYEDKNLTETHLRLDAAGAGLPLLPGAPTQFTTREGIDSSIEIRGTYCVGSGEGVEPDNWALYWDAGTGTVNFASALATAPLVIGAADSARFYHREPISTAGTYLFVLRTRIASAGVESDNADPAVAVVISSVAPAVPAVGQGRL